MTETIPNLWPEQFNVAVQTPLTILRVQATYLPKVTNGILEGVVETETAQDSVQHRLVVVAPAYNGYRHTLLTAIHKADLPYPAEVRAPTLAKRVQREPDGSHSVGSDAAMFGAPYDTVYPFAADDIELRNYVEAVLRSSQARSVILSLIAKSNEANPPTAFNSTSDLAPNGGGAA